MTAIQTFRQKSIRTVYDVDNANSSVITSCWGLESTMEGDPVEVGEVSRGTSPGNGRLNTLRCLLDNDHQNEESKKLKWEDVLNLESNNPEDRYKLKKNDALHAVLTRNRDLNGDGYVQPSEIRWYLAARDQLVDFYIGESALDDVSHLYPVNAADHQGQTYWHYTTSSAYDGGRGNVAWGLYAEECVALGATNNSGIGIPQPGGGAKKFTYRCVRNLGIGLDNPEAEPTALIPEATLQDGAYVIDCSNLSPKARRQSIETGHLPVHNDLSPYNRPYTKFQVAADDYAGSGQQVGRDYKVWGTYYYWQNWHPWSYYQTNQPSGYRVPNLRELLIMGTRLPKKAWKTYKGGVLDDDHYAFYLSFTTYSRGIYNQGSPAGGDGTFLNKKGGFRLNMNDSSIGATGTDFDGNGKNSGTDGGYVRGVKDIQ